MHVSLIDPNDNLVLVKIGRVNHDLPCAIDLDSHWARHQKGEQVHSGRYRRFNDREFYKLGKQLAKM